MLHGGFQISVESEKKLGLGAKDFVSKWVADNPVIRVSTTKDDKYGRILGELYGGNSKESLNEGMARSNPIR